MENMFLNILSFSSEGFENMSSASGSPSSSLDYNEEFSTREARLGSKKKGTKRGEFFIKFAIKPR